MVLMCVFLVNNYYSISEIHGVDSLKNGEDNIKTDL